MKFKKIIYAKEFVGMPKESDFKIVEEDLGDELKNNEFFYEALYVSCDPYLRLLSYTYTIGETTIAGYQLSKVIKSKNPKYAEGTLVVMNVGWRSGGRDDGTKVLYVRNDMPQNVSLSAGCGIFAMTGLASFYGFDRILKPKAGETLLVSGASGAIGTVVGQLGKIAGCRVIGSCESEEKIAFVKSVGYDDAFNYKKESVQDALKRLAPDGVDCYFENLGGDFASDILHNMNEYGRIAVCGSVPAYHAQGLVKTLAIRPTMFLRSLLIKRFNIFDDIPPHADEIYQVLRKYAEQGKLKQYEYVKEGFGSLPSALIAMLQGKNLGKTVVKV